LVAALAMIVIMINNNLLIEYCLLVLICW